MIKVPLYFKNNDWLGDVFKFTIITCYSLLYDMVIS